MTKQNPSYKIALIGDSLADGGAEKVNALLSVYFLKQGLEIHNCIFVDKVSYDYAGSLLNLGLINPNANPLTRKANRFLAFRKFIKENNFDAVIDFRMRPNFVQELLLSKLVYPKHTFYTVHSGILEFYFPKFSNFIYKNKKIVAVSKAIQKAVSDQKLAENGYQIYNPIDLESIGKQKNDFSVTEEKYILAVGRMNDEVKQFDQLILAYSKSVLPGKNIQLILLGEGKNRSKYEALSEELGLGNQIIFKGFTANPFPYYQKALFTVLSSKNEGFPNVILESLAVGTPVISYDCFSGPNEIIKNNQNGILVENQNQEKLIRALNLFSEIDMLYTHCKQNAAESVADFDIEIIGKQWLEILKNTVS